MINHGNKVRQFAPVASGHNNNPTNGGGRKMLPITRKRIETGCLL